MARKDLTNREIEELAKQSPGSAREYLRLRDEEIAAEKQAEREKDDYERFERAFVGASGTKSEASKAHKALKNERALASAREAEEAALLQSRRHIAGRL